MARKQNPEIRDFILRNADEHPTSVTSLAAKKFGLSRAGIGRYVERLVAEGLLDGEGRTRSRRYKLKPIADFVLPIVRGGMPPWTEDTVWRNHILPLMKEMPQNITQICQYGFTEMLNNVIDHSQSPDVVVSYTQTYATIEMRVIDHGIGIFNKIQRDFNLADARTALLELSKGKITSDKRRHSGEGIYFTSRMFSGFGIVSGHLVFTRLRSDSDGWLIESEEKHQETKGTFVAMTIRTDAGWTMRDVFDKFQGDDIYFRSTHVPVSLGRYPGEQLVSRSQAKRILTRFTDFSEVMLDFAGVTEIGQPFADEIFRVFKNEHPQIKIFAFNTNKAIEKMIEYVQSEHSTLPLPLPGPKPQ